MVRRRGLMLSVATVSIAAPVALLAQLTRLRRVVWVGFGPLAPSDRPVLDPWQKAFRELGYVEGVNLSLEYRYVEAATEGRSERLAELLATLVRQEVDVLFSPRPEVILAAKQATRTIPIVFATIGDPVGSGLVESFGRPGGNVTGIAFDSSPDFAGKQLQLLHEVVPSGRTFGVLSWNSPDAGEFNTAAKSAGNAMGVVLRPAEVREAAELDATFARFSSQSVTGILVLGSAYTFVYRERLATLAANYRMPAIYANRQSVDAGGLMSYGPILGEQFRLAAIYIDRILKGAKPADLPVEQPAKFELVVNLKAAKALGVTIPNTVLLQANEVIS
jgi:putative tryptophan/tyrosine transport system substrate-binding protein